MTQKARSADTFRKINDFMSNSMVSVAILSVLISVLVLAVLSIIYGANPLRVITTLFQGAFNSRRAVIQTFSQMTPLILTALAVYIPYKVGFFNVGGQGQLELAALAAVFLGTNFQGNSFAAILLMLLVSMLVGTIVVVIPLLLKLKRGANEVTTTIMMTFVCVNFLNAMVTGTLKDPAAFYGATRSIPRGFMLPNIPGLAGYHIGIAIAVIIALIIGWMMKNTVIGYYLRVVGQNMEAARVAGVNVRAITIGAVLLGGALAGLAGGIMVTGVTSRVALGWSMTWGFTGITIAFLGASPITLIPIALLMAILETGSRYMQAMTSVPAALIPIIQGVPVIAFVCLTAYKKHYLNKRKRIS